MKKVLKLLTRYVPSHSVSELISVCSANWITPTAGLQQALDHLSLAGHHLDTAYASFLRQSKCPVDVQLIHDHAIARGHDRGTFLGNVLVQMYARYGDLSRAQAVFDNIWEKNVYSWNIIIAAYATNGHFDAAVDMFYEMEREGVSPNRVTFLAVLGACANLKDLEEARRIHGLVTRFRLHTEVMVCNALINVYGKCGSVDEARHVFDNMRGRNVVSWTTMIGTYSQDERHAAEAIELYYRMDVPPTEVTFISVLEACASLGDLSEGRGVHARIIEYGFQPQVVAGKLIGNALVNMYGRSGSLTEANEVFNCMQHRDVAAWNAMVSAYARAGHSDAAIHTVRLMDLLGLKPNHITFTSAISACTGWRMYPEGVKLHERVASSGVEPDIILQNSLITMYSRCGSLDAAHDHFNCMPRRNTQSWNALIGACVQHGEFDQALHLFHHMQARQDSVTFVSVLGACSSPVYFPQGSLIHERIISAGLEQDPVVGSALVNMYTKCGGLEEAKAVFDRLTTKTIISWTAMVDAFVHYGCGSDALKLFRYMEMEGWKPNDITYIGLLGACSATGAFSQGKALHERVTTSGCESDIIRVALVNLYGKCAKVEEAREIFNELRYRPTVAWNAMISAYAQQGYGAEAVHLFYDMTLEGAEVNDITFMSLLFGCSHEGLAEKSWEFFRSMSGDYGVSPTGEHHGTMVDILARQGHLEKAEELLTSMPFQADVVSWTSLLGACKTHSDTERGARIAKHVFQLDREKSAAPYSLLTNIFSEAGRVDEAYRTCKLMETRGARRQTARSFIEVGNRIHDFVVGDSSHPENDRIRAELQRLHEQMKEEGYTPDRQVVLHKVDEQEKEGLLMFHSERLAVAYGLISSPNRTTDDVRVVKNIRVCSDCHTAIKLISKLVQRKIVLRDANRFHHFQHGTCSCKDYW